MPALDKALDGIIHRKKEDSDFISNSIESLELVKKYFRKELRNEDIKCYALLKTMPIATNGDLTACDLIYGNVRLGEIQRWWRSDRAWRSRMTIKECRNPCILPCFTDTGLNSFSRIFTSFFNYLDDERTRDITATYRRAEKCLTMVKKYERLLRKLSSEAFSLGRLKGH